jgi:hypothetical protein
VQREYATSAHSLKLRPVAVPTACVHVMSLADVPVLKKHAYEVVTLNLNLDELKLTTPHEHVGTHSSGFSRLYHARVCPYVARTRETEDPLAGVGYIYNTV